MTILSDPFLIMAPYILHVNISMSGIMIGVQLPLVIGVQLPLVIGVSSL